MNADDLGHISRILRTIQTNDYLVIADGRVTIDGSTAITDAEHRALACLLGQNNCEDGESPEGRLADAEQRIQKVRDLHQPFRIYDECTHRHGVEDDGRLPDGVQLVASVGLVCEDAFMYEICRECCTDGGEYQTEQCAEHFHKGAAACYPCPTLAALDGAS